MNTIINNIKNSKGHSISFEATSEEIFYPPLYGAYTGVLTRGMTGSPDGKYLYIGTYGTPEKTLKIELTAENDLTSYISTIFSTYNPSPVGLYVKEDGTRFYQPRVAVSIYQRDPTIPFDPTPTVNNVVKALDIPNYIYGMGFSNDGLLFYTYRAVTAGILVYELTIPFDVNSVVSTTGIVFNCSDSSGNLLAVRYGLIIDSGNKIIVGTSTKMYLFELTVPNDARGGMKILAETEESFTVGAFAILITSDLKNVYTVSDGDDILRRYNLNVKF